MLICPTCKLKDLLRMFCARKSPLEKRCGCCSMSALLSSRIWITNKILQKRNNAQDWKWSCHKSVATPWLGEITHAFITHYFVLQPYNLQPTTYDLQQRTYILPSTNDLLSMPTHETDELLVIICLWWVVISINGDSAAGYPSCSVETLFSFNEFRDSRDILPFRRFQW
jgi:hypothetical protein